MVLADVKIALAVSVILMPIKILVGFWPTLLIVVSLPKLTLLVVESVEIELEVLIVKRRNVHAS